MARVWRRPVSFAGVENKIRGLVKEFRVFCEYLRYLLKKTAMRWITLKRCAVIIFGQYWTDSHGSFRIQIIFVLNFAVMNFIAQVASR